MLTRPMTAREERRYGRKAARSYSHMIGKNCNEFLRGTCWRCVWWSITGKHRARNRRLIERARSTRPADQA